MNCGHTNKVHSPPDTRGKDKASLKMYSTFEATATFHFVLEQSQTKTSSLGIITNYVDWL